MLEVRNRDWNGSKHQGDRSPLATQVDPEPSQSGLRVRTVDIPKAREGGGQGGRGGFFAAVRISAAISAVCSGLRFGIPATEAI